MIKKVLSTTSCLVLSGCIGTWITQRETDTSKPYPSLHSVPERPTKKDFTSIDNELQDFEEDYSESIKENQQLRDNNHTPVKPE